MTEDSNVAAPVFIADTCIGGLSVLKSLWASGTAGHAIFLADYAVNPLGVKSDSDIAEVVDRWMGIAGEYGDTLLTACNTLSIRYHQMRDSAAPASSAMRSLTMVDCLEAMANDEAARLANSKVLVVGTAFTASQALYPNILGAAAPGVCVDSVAATELERRIARFEPWSSSDESVLTTALRQAIEQAEIAVLACTCFPMAVEELQSVFPEVVFLDPGAYCPTVMPKRGMVEDRKLTIRVTGDVVEASQVSAFAKSYLGAAAVVSCQGDPP